MVPRWSLSWLVVAAAAVALPTAVTATAQEPPAEPAKEEAAKPAAVYSRPPLRGDVTKVFVLKHVSPRTLAEVLKVFPATLAFAAGNIGVSAPPAVMAAIEETIKRLDVPAPTRSVELTGYVLEALTEPLESSPVPAELEGVIGQLRRTFSYASYRLLDTLIARATEDRSFSVESTGSDETKRSREIAYRFSANRTQVVSGEAGPTVRLLDFRFQAEIPPPATGGYAGGGRGRSLAVRGDIEIRAGQRAVVGKSGTGDPAKAIILVLSARLDSPPDSGSAPARD